MNTPETQRASAFLGEAITRAIDNSPEVQEAVRWLRECGISVRGYYFQVHADAPSPADQNSAASLDREPQQDSDFFSFMRSIGATDPEGAR